MSTNLTTFTDRVNRILTGISTDEMSTATRQEAVREAVREYGRDKPRVMVEDVSGDGGQYYQLGSSGVLTSWANDFSQILAVDYPAADVDDDEEPEFLEDEDFTVYRVAGSTRYLYFPNHAPASGEAARVWYTTYYEFDSSNETETPTGDFDAICTLAGAICCEWLAVRYGQHSDSTIGADVVNRRNKSDVYASRAKDLRRRYMQELLGQGGEQPAAAFVGDIDMGWGFERDFLFHRRRQR